MKHKGKVLAIIFVIVIYVLSVRHLDSASLAPSNVSATAAISGQSSSARSLDEVVGEENAKSSSPFVTPVKAPSLTLTSQFDSDHSNSSPSSVRAKYPLLWHEFAKKMPKPYMAPRNWEGIHTGDITELEFKAKNGDLAAKWLYAQQVQVRLDHELNRQYPISSSIPPAQKMEWLKRYEPIRQLYSECAVEGSLGCVKGLIGTPYHPALRDEIDSLAWIFIIGGMTGRVEQALGYFCELEKLSCTDEMVAKGFERAAFYLDYYQFNLEKAAQ